MLLHGKRSARQPYVDKSYMNSDQEEEDDIKLIPHVAVSTATSMVSGSLSVTGHYVLVLAICLYSALCKTLYSGNDH